MAIISTGISRRRQYYTIPRKRNIPHHKFCLRFIHLHRHLHRRSLLALPWFFSCPPSCYNQTSKPRNCPPSLGPTISCPPCIPHHPYTLLPLRLKRCHHPAEPRSHGNFASTPSAFSKLHINVRPENPNNPHIEIDCARCAVHSTSSFKHCKCHGERCCGDAMDCSRCCWLWIGIRICF